MEFTVNDLFNRIGSSKEYKYEARLVESIKDFHRDELFGSYVKNAYLIVTGCEPDTISKFSMDKLKWYAHNWGYRAWKDEYENVYRFSSLALTPNN